uniref:Heterokaryon incompatibility domain-containing protein n=1 Tax=Bionectria ochroleuca TaxID=29856 RepID=A0A8H7TID3_BIOOC
MQDEMGPFLYSPVDTTDGEIRLLTLHPASDKEALIVCDLERVKLRDNPQFEAISYTWGDEHPSVQIVLNDAAFKVRENAAAALRRLRRRKGSRRVWIDAICINQGRSRSATGKSR